MNPLALIWTLILDNPWWAALLLSGLVVVAIISAKSSSASSASSASPPGATESITFTYDGGTLPVFDLIVEQGYNRDTLRQVIIDYLNGHSDKATLCGTANCTIDKLI